VATIFRVNVPSAFLAPPPPYPYICPSPYVTSFPLPPPPPPPPSLYPLRPLPLAPMTQFHSTSFDGCVGFKPGGLASVADEPHEHLLRGVATSSWHSVDVPSDNDHRVHMSTHASGNCGGEPNEDVEEVEMTDNEHIDVDTVDDDLPPASAAAECLSTSSTGMGQA